MNVNTNTKENKTGLKNAIPEQKSVGKNHPKELLKARRRKENKSGAEIFKMGSRYHGSCLTNWQGTDQVKEALSRWIMKPKGFLNVLGNPGTGKTELCASLLNYFYENGEDIHFVRSMDFFKMIQQNWGTASSHEDIIEKYSITDFFIFDELGTGTNSNWQIEKLHEIIDNRYANQKPTIISSNLSFERIKNELSWAIYDRMRANEHLSVELWEKSNRWSE